MTDQEHVFCYHCRRHHREDEVVPFVVNGRKRWRCLASIRKSQGSVTQRDAFGRSVSEFNLSNRPAQHQNRWPACVSECLTGRRKPPQEETA